MEYRSIIEESELFDENFYIEHYRDVRMSDELPLEHFVNYGLKEDRKPNEWFDPVWYKGFYEDIQGSDIYPFIHYILYGKDEGRFRNKEEKEFASYLKTIEDHFDKKWYSEIYNVYDIDPVEHFLRWGWKEGKKPNPEFDVFWYLEEYPDVKESGMNPFVHYILYGKENGRLQSDPYIINIESFNFNLFREANPNIKLAAGNIEDALQNGKLSFHPKYQPFDESKYLKYFLDIEDAVKNKKIKNGYEHFQKYGYKEILEGKRKWIIKKELNQYITDREVLFISHFKVDKFLNISVNELNERLNMAKNYYNEVGFWNIINGKSLFHVDYEAFDEEKYLNIFPDLIDAIINGTIKDPIQHFIDYGYNEIITGTRKWPMNTLKNKNVEKLRFINFCKIEERE